MILLALIGAIYSQIAPLNRFFFSANEEATLRTKQPIRFQGLKDKEYHVANFATFVSKTLIISPLKMDEFNLKLDKYCINKIFELTKSCIWAISKWV